MLFNEVTYRQWTKIALECRKRNCKCDGCFYQEFFKRSAREGSEFNKCQMKYTVIQLIRKFGEPEDNQLTVDSGFWNENGDYIEEIETIQERDI